MRTRSKLMAVILGWITCTVYGQQLVLPEREGWNVVAEGATVSFRVQCSEPGAKRFALEGADGYGMTIDSTGWFSWTPHYDLVDRLERKKEVTIIFQAEWGDGRRARRAVTFSLLHTNRPPVIEELPVFYVRQSVANRYQIPAEYISDPDRDPVSIKPVPSKLPEGASLSPAGVLLWTPSRNQFNSLKNNPVTVEFFVQDQPERTETRGRLRIAQTQQDLPPDLLLVPGDSVITIKEDERIALKIFASDPNGDEDLASLDFLSSDPRVNKTAFVPSGFTQAEFSWLPGYGFTEEAEKIRPVDLIFFVIDKETNRTERRVRVNVADTENLVEKDKLRYLKYRATLVQAKALIDQLDENQVKLNKMYRQAKRGKKHRAFLNAGLGAATGLSPVVLDTESGKVVSGIGGTTVLTLGTLEATEVIGKSKADILEKLKINVEIRNQLQLEGDNFARKYALKSARRAKEFESDREKLVPVINNQKLVLLELDASRPSYPKLDNKDIKKTFPDFAEED
jgi:hypothetical protein